jgi:hypothetical protein
MEMALTAVFKKVPEGYIGFVEELPAANTQGATLEEARARTFVKRSSSCWRRCQGSPETPPSEIV